MRILLPVLMVMQASCVFAHADTLSNQIDTALFDRSESIRSYVKRMMIENRRKISDKQSKELQNQKISRLRSLAKESKDYINKGIDTAGISKELSRLEDLYQLTAGKIVSNNTKLYSLRNLTSSELLLREILKKLESVNKPLTIYQKSIDKKRKSIDSLLIDSTLYFLPSDTSLFIIYEKGYLDLIKELRPIEIALNTVTGSIRKLSERVDGLKSDILRDINRAESYRKSLSYSMFNQEISKLFSESEGELSFGNSVSFSIIKATSIIFFFFENNTGILLLILVFMLSMMYYFSLISRRIFSKKEQYHKYLQDQIVEHPVISAFFVAVNISQFFFAFPPFAIQALMWILLSFALLVLHKRDPGIFGKGMWIYLIVLFILVITDNLILEPSLFEVWFLVIISLASVILAFNYLRTKKELYSEISVVKWILYIFLVLEAGAFIAIISGRYNLCKTLFTSGYFAVISGIFLYWTYQLIISALNIYFISLKSYDKKNIFVNFKKFNEKNPFWIYGAFVFGWFVILIRNFYFYSVITTQLSGFMIAERSIGKYTYTFQSIFVFVFIIVLSGLISKLLSFITDSSGKSVTGPINKKGGISNWVLLIRLTIIVIGVLLAFAAAGIPMSKLTIIIGSLGVGIGFGLQNIVSNLISGVILAFERPIEIGDQIEVAGKVGRIKEIGIRSSRMVNLDGAEVIIPNGDLLSQHVINWTLSNNHRRVELIVAVKYGTDLIKVREILEGVLKSNERIEKSPSPTVLLHLLNNSSVDFRLLFWCDINFWLDCKSEIILAVYSSFKEAGIEIPFPQQDVHIKDFPPDKEEKQ